MKIVDSQALKKTRRIWFISELQDVEEGNRMTAFSKLKMDW